AEPLAPVRAREGRAHPALDRAPVPLPPHDAAACDPGYGARDGRADRGGRPVAGLDRRRAARPDTGTPVIGRAPRAAASHEVARLNPARMPTPPRATRF